MGISGMLVPFGDFGDGEKIPQFSGNSNKHKLVEGSDLILL
jgi:hypothetical protein